MSLKLLTSEPTNNSDDEPLFSVIKEIESRVEVALNVKRFVKHYLLHELFFEEDRPCIAVAMNVELATRPP